MKHWVHITILRSWAETFISDQNDFQTISGVPNTIRTAQICKTQVKIAFNCGGDCNRTLPAPSLNLSFSLVDTCLKTERCFLKVLSKNAWVLLWYLVQQRTASWRNCRKKWHRRDLWSITNTWPNNWKQVIVSLYFKDATLCQLTDPNYFHIYRQKFTR